ncbi:GNAT family N-acetyltransferase [Intrasporangium sp. YIM S08009]|uniref:GNAT family N-acetyltransferase n=1 Tax=Intrasporangium zincisolvens TaxID=3080018 RepID=UPI002B05DE00|nr:GNAT family N-acetyltransferase [Intrasporangium sp. YIM S08009]
MTEITVRPLGEDDWQDYRSVRLAALRESPEAFAASIGQEESYGEDLWRERMRRSARLVAEREGDAVGVVSVGTAKSDEEGSAGELFGLWVHPEARGSGVATTLVKEGARLATERGQTHLVYWVGTENGRAVAFASGMGFRPTDYRRPMGVVSEEDGEEEIAMVLPLGADRSPALHL